MPEVRAPLPRDVEQPKTERIAALLRAESELEKQRVGECSRFGSSLPPVGLRTYPNRPAGVRVQTEDDGTSDAD